MILPLVMIGSTLVFKDGDGIKEDEAANYALNLENVLAELLAPVLMAQRISGRSCHATLTSSTGSSDFRQELSCSINIKHREEFDEEKEPDRMVLSRWSASVEEQINSKGEKNRQLLHHVHMPLMTLLRIYRLNLG
ncbi:hypothetical protein VPH35_066153 [Triticum aestivum]